MWLSDVVIYAALGGAATLYACLLDRQQARYMPEKAYLATAGGVALILLAVGALAWARPFHVWELYAASWIAFFVGGAPIAAWRQMRERKITQVRLALQNWAAVEARRRRYAENGDGDSRATVAAQSAQATGSGQENGALDSE